jgi:hypothetical protein
MPFQGTGRKMRPTTAFDRYLADQMKDDEFKREYENARTEICLTDWSPEVKSVLARWLKSRYNVYKMR